MGEHERGDGIVKQGEWSFGLICRGLCDELF
jgi:hypothetical protein